jgi:protein phosphatase
MNETGNDNAAPFFALTVAERTDRGRVRENNEDVALSVPESGLFVVADGMGGAREGEVAARVVSEHLKDACSDPLLGFPGRIRRCKEAVNAASLWIRQYAARQGNPGMGTTVAVLLFDPWNQAAAACLHAGDSRLYRFRNGTLEQLTRDHSVAALAGADHEGQVPSLFRSVITRAVGVRRNVELETTSLDVARGDLYLLCTDGLNGMVSTDEITRVLGRASDLDAKAVALVEAALAAGGDDNVTVMLVRMGGAPDLVAEGCADAQAERTLSAPARETRAKALSGSPLVSLLALALLGIVGVWFAFVPWRNHAASAASAPPAAPVRAAQPPAPDIPGGIPAPALAPPVVPPPAAGSAPQGPASGEAAWQRERGEVATDPERLKVRHQAVLNAFHQLSEWAGKPLAPPSLMMAGHAEDRPDAWVRYLAAAEIQWVGFCATECSRMRVEAGSLNPDGLNILFRWASGTDEADPAFRALLADWEGWTRELDRMEQFLRDEADPQKPFLYAASSGLFASGRSAADLGDRTWDRVLPLINTLWKKRDAMLARTGESGAAWVDDTIRQANAIWTGYTGADFRVRAWRQGLDPAGIKSFFERLAAEQRERGQQSP